MDFLVLRDPFGKGDGYKIHATRYVLRRTKSAY